MGRRVGERDGLGVGLNVGTSDGLLEYDGSTVGEKELDGGGDGTIEGYGDTVGAGVGSTSHKHGYSLEHPTPMT